MMRKYLEFVGGIDGRCFKCKNHKYLVLDVNIEVGRHYLHSHIDHSLPELSMNNMIHAWEFQAPPCRAYYKEIV